MKVEVEIGEISKETLSNDIIDSGLRIVEIMNASDEGKDNREDSALELLHELAYHCLRVIEMYKIK